MDNGGTMIGTSGKPEYQFKIGNRLVWMTYDSAQALLQKHRDGILDSWWYETNDK
jgi:hypothetical protein